MQEIDGFNLRHWRNEEPNISPLEICKKIAKFLLLCRTHNVFHYDLNGDNVMVEKVGRSILFVDPESILLDGEFSAHEVFIRPFFILTFEALTGTSPSTVLSSPKTMSLLSPRTGAKSIDSKNAVHKKVLFDTLTTHGVCETLIDFILKSREETEDIVGMDYFADLFFMSN